MRVPRFLQPLQEVGTARPRRPHDFSTGVATPGGPLPVSIPPQQLSEWCWAATTCGVRRFYREPNAADQCSIASATLGWRCCPPGLDSPSNPNNVPYALATPLGPNLSGHPVGSALDCASLVAEIDGGRPIACAIEWRGGGNLHFNVVAGYTSAGDVVVRDPKYLGDHHLPYSAFKDGYMDKGRWRASLKTRKAPA